MTLEQYVLYEGERVRKETLAEARRENAVSLLRMNLLTPAQIAQAVSLSLDEVLALKENLSQETAPAALP